MKKSRNGRALLVELLIVLFFFGLCTAIVLRSMMTVGETAAWTRQKRVALREVQGEMAYFSAVDDWDAVLVSRGYQKTEEGMAVEREDFILLAEVSQEAMPSGVLHTVQLRAVSGEKVLVQLPCSRYVPKGAE